MTTQPKLYTRIEVAELLKVSLSTVAAIIKAGDMYFIRVGRGVRIPEQALNDYVAGRPAYVPPAPITGHDATTWPPTPSMFGDDAK